MTSLHIDLETRSAVDLKKTGADVYAEHPTTDVWVARYAFGDGPIETWKPGAPCPGDIVEHVLLGGTVVGHNAAFERTIWNHILGPRYGWPIPEVTQYRCTMIMAREIGLPGALENAAPAAGLKVSKDMIGSRIMLQLAKPRKLKLSKRATVLQKTDKHAYAKAFQATTRDGKMNSEGIEIYRLDGEIFAEILWWVDPEKHQRLDDYCGVDVEVERQLEKKLLPLHPRELNMWHLDQVINSRGVLVDRELALAATNIVAVAQARLNEQIAIASEGAITATTNVNQIIAFAKQHGVDVDSIKKDVLEDLLAPGSDIPPVLRTTLEFRQQASKSSVTKINTLLGGTSPVDGRARGLLQFCAANTKRWCLAEGTPVLVRRDGAALEVPIETVEATDQVWDGEEWVSHEGVVFSGKKEVIEHDGLRATPQHVVYLDDRTAIPFGQAKQEGRALWRGTKRNI